MPVFNHLWYENTEEGGLGDWSCTDVR